MHGRWRAIERSLRQEVMSASTALVGELAALRTPAIRGFASAAEIIGHLHGAEGSDEGRDRVLAELVTASREPGRLGRLARTMVWLALWPGLTAIWRQTLARSREDSDELAGDVIEKFALAIHRFDCKRAEKTAATLLWNTRRLFWASLKERSAWRSLHVSFGSDDRPKASASGRGPAELVAAVVDIRRAAGKDADLVVLCHLEGLSTREVAARCGVAREAMKKRIQRALVRCRLRDGGSMQSPVPVRGARPLMEGVGRQAGLDIADARDSLEVDGDTAVVVTVELPVAQGALSERGAR